MKKILVVDDNDTIRLLARTSLELLGGHAVVEAMHGKQAQEILAKESFDLILTDLDMPYVTGQELIRWLRESPAHKNTPIIVLSALSDEKKRDQLINELNLQHFLVKPFDPQQLDEVVNRVLAGA